MCGRFNQADTNIIKRLERHWKREERNALKDRYNISPGMGAEMLTATGEFIATFGFRPSWNPKLLLINARAEGKDGNPDNNPVSWTCGIQNMPAYKKAFSSARCVIPVTGFLEGPEKEKLSKPHLISRQDGGEIYLGGIYNLLVDMDTGEETMTFAIITTPNNPPTAYIGHHRSPLMLGMNDLDLWLDSKDQKELFMLMERGYCEPGLQVTELFPELVKSGREHGEETMKAKTEPVHFQ